MKFFPQEVENNNEIQGITDVAVIGYKTNDDMFDTKIKAMYVSKENLNLSLRQFCVKILEPYKVPNKFEHVEKIPRTSSGK